jgi:hypothetical protein
MDGTNRGTRRADTALSGDLVDLITKNGLLDLSDDPLPILKAQPEPLWAGNPVRSRNAVKLVNALLPIVKGRFNRNPDIHGSSHPKELTLAWATPSTRTPLFCPLPMLQRHVFTE